MYNQNYIYIYKYIKIIFIKNKNNAINTVYSILVVKHSNLQIHNMAT